jgi:N-acetylglucosaminyl-diphospho-decaprenol L-rhamnosyltransferase
LKESEAQSAVVACGPEPSPAAAAGADRAPVDVTAIIVSYNTAHLLEQAIGLLKESAAGMTLQISIVDNASRDGSVALIHQRFADCDFIANTANVGFGRANNQMLASARGRYVLLLNTDAFVEPQTLHKTVEFMDQNPRCGVLGVRLEGRDHVLQPSCRYFPTPWNSFLVRTGLNRVFTSARLVDDMGWDHASVRECDWVPGCYYLVRREVIEEVGLFDPRFFLYYEEVDHCRAVKAAGWKVVYFPHTTVIHIGGESAKSDGRLTSSGGQIAELQVESELLYFRKHHGWSGLLAHLALKLLADVALVVKALLRQRAVGILRAQWRDWVVWSKLLRRTRWGVQATR